jgi:hypothetical protein
MYIGAIAALMFICPAISVAADAGGDGVTLALIGEWFVFWAVGIRLFSAGVRQIANPGLTSEGILGIQGSESWVLVRELGFANVAIGAVAIASKSRSEWRLAAALAGGIFLLLAGIQHVVTGARTREETIAMVSDLAIAVLMGIYLAGEL